MRKITYLFVATMLTLATACSNKLNEISVFLQYPEDAKFPFFSCLRASDGQPQSIEQCLISSDCKNLPQEAYATCSASRSQYYKANRAQFLRLFAESKSEKKNGLQIKITKVELVDEANHAVTLKADPGPFSLHDVRLYEQVAKARFRPTKYKEIRLHLAEASILYELKGVRGRQKRGELLIPFESAEAKIITLRQNLDFSRPDGYTIALSIDPKASWAGLAGITPGKFSPKARIEEVTGGSFQSGRKPLNVQLLGGDLELTAPVNFSDQSLAITATKISPTQLPTIKGSVLAAVELLPSQTFREPLTVRARLTPNNFTRDNISVQYYDVHRKNWIKIPAINYDAATRTVQFQTRHFTIFSVTGSDSFTLSEANGSSLKLSYDFFNTLANKFVPAQLPQLNLSGSVYPFATDISTGTVLANIDGNIFPKNIDLRNLEVVSGHYLDNKIKLRIRAKRSFTLAAADINLHTAYQAPPGGCSGQYNACVQDCNTYCWPVCWLKIFGKCIIPGTDCNWSGLSNCQNHNWGCYGNLVGCNFLTSALESHSNGKKKFALNALDYTIVLRVSRDASGALKFDYDGETLKEGSGSWFSLVVSDVQPFVGTGLLTTVINVANDYVNNQAAAMLEAPVEDILKNQLAPQLAATLSAAFSNSMPALSAQLAIDSSGIGFNQDMYATFQPIPDIRMSCANPPNIPNAGNSTFQSLGLQSGSHFGIGTSQSAIRQIFTEFANRGYFCYNGDLGTSGATIRITPNGQISLTVDMNTSSIHFTIPTHVEYAPVAGATQSANGSITLRYRIQVGLGLSGLGFEFVDAQHGFSDPLVVPVLNGYLAQLQTAKANNPQAFNVALNLDSPISYLGVHPSMFRQQRVASDNGFLAFEFKTEGMKLDYSGTGPGTEWLWLASYQTDQGLCSPQLTGRLMQDNGQYILFDNGSSVPVATNHLNPAIAGQLIGQRANFAGTCTDESAFNIVHHLTESFYLNSMADLTPASNFTAQAVGPYAQGLGEFAINTHNDAVPEILYVLRDGAGNFTLKWYIENSCCSGSLSDAKTYSMSLPATLGSNFLYRVERIPRDYPLNDKIRLNEKVYRIRVENDIVYLDLESEFGLVEVQPADGGTAVYLDSKITVAFNKALNAATVMANTDSSCSGTVQVSADNFTTCIPMTNSMPVFTNGLQNFEFTPTGLFINTNYKIRLTTGIFSIDGVALDVQYQQPAGFRTILPPAQQSFYARDLVNFTDGPGRIGYQVVTTRNLAYVVGLAIGIYSMSGAGTWQFEKNLIAPPGYMIQDSSFGTWLAAAGDLVAFRARVGTENHVLVYRRLVDGSYALVSDLTNPMGSDRNFAHGLAISDREIIISEHPNTNTDHDMNFLVYDISANHQAVSLKQTINIFAPFITDFCGGRQGRVILIGNGYFAATGSTSSGVGCVNILTKSLNSPTYDFGQGATHYTWISAFQGLAVSDNLIAAGASNTSNKVVIFQRSNGYWGAVTEIQNPSGQAGDLFGASLAINGNKLLVGSPGFGSSQGYSSPEYMRGILYAYDVSNPAVPVLTASKQHTISGDGIDGPKTDQFCFGLATNSGFGICTAPGTFYAGLHQPGALYFFPVP